MNETGTGTRLIYGDCLEVLAKMESNSIDSIVCDPPYGISILGEEWDKSLPSRKIWRECFRVLKPGGYVLAFSSGLRYHHLAEAMEGVGFETQNMMAWLYSNGLPRGEKLSREFDRGDGLPLPDDAFRGYLRDAINRSPYKIADLEKMCGTNGMFSHYLGKSQAAFPTLEKWRIIKAALGLGGEYDDLFEKIEKRRQEFKSSKDGARGSGYFSGMSRKFDRHVPKSELAKKWQGWAYGKMVLRPCMEPIYCGQKPPLRPVRENVKRHGVGAMNIEACKCEGRTPSNVMHDGSPEVEERLTRESPTAAVSLNRFFFVPKARGKEKEGNNHPTVKPVALMAHLVRLVTPPGGVCLDPFMGSGTTGVACRMEGFDFVGIEREEEYFLTARDRISQYDSGTHHCNHEKEAI